MQPMIERVGSYEDLKRHVVTESSGLKTRRGVTTTLLVMLCLLCTPHIIAYPIGIGQEADNGCLCHGIAEESVSINITGIPEKWESNTTYTISFSVSNNDANQDRGGFRLLISDGELNYSSEKVQELDGGLTHTSNGSQQRNWSVIWTSPQNANKTPAPERW